MSKARRGLWIAVLAGAVVAAAGSHLSNELLWRVVDPSQLESISSILLLHGSVALLGGGLAAVLVCRLIAGSTGTPARLAWGTGLAVGAQQLAVGLDGLADALFFSDESWRDHLEVYSWFRIGLVATAVLIFAGLRVAGAKTGPASAVTVGVLALRGLVNLYQFGPYEHTTLVEIRSWLVVVGVPLLCGAAAVLLSRDRVEEPVLS